MPSRLSLFAEQIIEGGWLAALIVAPLFFNTYSNRVFEVGPVALVRTLALVMLAAWLVREVESAAFRPESGWRERLTTWSRANPLALPVVLLLLGNLISTLASIS